MKKILFSLVAIGGLLVSCSSDDNSSNENGTTVGGITAPQKVIRVLDKIEVHSVTEGTEIDKKEQKSVITYVYENGKLLKVLADNNETVGEIKYNKDGIESISNIEDSFFLSEIVGKKIDGSKFGKVDQIHNGNPVALTFYTYDDEDKVIEDESKVTLTFDKKPFFAFHTLNTTGVIDLSKKTQIDFGTVGGAALSGINEANKLLPVNNITEFKFFYEEGETFSGTAVYEYDKDDYPTSATFKTIENYHYYSWDPVNKKEIKNPMVEVTNGTVKFYFKELK
ncbi:hypothetical protein [Myroides phaeus]|uniref:DUF4595 domain-containing protein n=1 Tax=Myroides phaeus TaxID=702745 RepID=A0A1G8FGC1_9FLAO|nr:hypothetical protein [Myroides phaeus]MEC4115373.1 hypothetical protein [Myroides phaeus]SDH81049.1 hypothetical protein SAMN05421818_11653 [Myroides phaeus]